VGTNRTSTCFFVLVLSVLCRPVSAGDAVPTTSSAASTQPASSSQEPAPSASFDDSTHLTDGWFGWRHRLADDGVTFDASQTIDGTKNLMGGITTSGSAWRSLFDLAATVDTKCSLGLEGGTFYADFQWAQGPNASDKLIGDVQGIDNLDGVPGAPDQNRTQLSQIWYQQIALNGLLRIKIGKVDSNTEFDHSTFAQPFLNQSAGSSATLFTMPTYPDPAFGVNFFLKPSPDIQIGFGAYDGALANGIATGSMGPSSLFKGNGSFLIAELDKSWALGPDQLPGRTAIGGWYSTNTFERLAGGEQSGTGGPYFLVDQALWLANPKDNSDARGVGAFVMGGYADPSILQYDYNIGGGVTWTGPLSIRPADILGLGVQAVHFSADFNAKSDFEINYELLYQLQVTPWFAVKPDLQYVVNPGGQGTPNALAFTVRFQVTF
jgi:porin